MALFGSPTRVNKRVRDFMERPESDPLWRSPITPKVNREGFSYSCVEPSTVTPSRFYMNAANAAAFMEPPPARPSTPPRRDSGPAMFACPPLSPSNRQALNTSSPKRHTLKLSSPKRHSLTLSSPQYASPVRTTSRALPKPSPRRLSLTILDKEDKEDLNEDALNDLLASDDVRTWVQDNIAGVAEKGKITRLARVQMGAFLPLLLCPQAPKSCHGCDRRRYATLITKCSFVQMPNDMVAIAT